MLTLVNWPSYELNVEIRTNNETDHVSVVLDRCSSEKIWIEGIIVQNEKVGQQHC